MAAAPAPAAPPSRPWWLLPAVLAGTLMILAAAAYLLALRGRDREPPRPEAFVPPSPARPLTVLDVQQVQGASLTLAGSGRNVQATLPPTLPLYSLQPARPADIAPGDWLTIIGLPNEVLNFAIRLVVLVPAALAPQLDDEGIPRLAGGLAGHEASRDPRERPLLAGRVERVEPAPDAGAQPPPLIAGRGEATATRRITLALRSGSVTLDVEAGSPLRRLTPGAVTDIREGDRIAFYPPRPDAGADAAPALLVLPTQR